MSFSTLIRSDAAPATEGYGNTRDSLTVTGARIADNEICEGDYRQQMALILKDKDRERAGKRLQQFWDAYLANFPTGGKEWHAGQDRLFAMLNGVTRGKLTAWLGYLTPAKKAA
jgi:hypothetical protein